MVNTYVVHIHVNRVSQELCIYARLSRIFNRYVSRGDLTHFFEET